MKRIRNIVSAVLLTAALTAAGNGMTSLAYSTGETFILDGTVSVYMNASDASQGVNAVKTYAPGTYYIYKASNGMINISRSPGTSGGWINPGSGTTEPGTKAPETTVPAETKPATAPQTGDYVLTASTAKYVSADNALKGVASVGTYPAGNYYIYKSYNGMLNITKNKGVPGGWINPGTSSPEVTKPVTTTPKPATTTPKPATTTPKPATTAPAPSNGSTYTVKASVATYRDSSDALNMKNSVGSYPAGTYYIYKTYSNMLNISRTPGVPGAWINPQGTSPAPTPGTGTTNPPTDLSKYKQVTFSLTFYTDLPSENGGYSASASGMPLKYGLVSSNVYSFGTKIYLEGMGEFTVGDRGGSEFNSSTRLDVLIERKPGESDSQYLARVNAMGRQTVKGYIIK